MGCHPNADTSAGNQWSACMPACQQGTPLTNSAHLAEVCRAQRAPMGAMLVVKARPDHQLVAGRFGANVQDARGAG